MTAAASQAEQASGVDQPSVTWLHPAVAASVLASYAADALAGARADDSLTRAFKPLARRVVAALAEQGYQLICCDNSPDLPATALEVR